MKDWKKNWLRPDPSYLVGIYVSWLTKGHRSEQQVFVLEVELGTSLT
jgi:hypothetical protein